MVDELSLMLTLEVFGEAFVSIPDNVVLNPREARVLHPRAVSRVYASRKIEELKNNIRDNTYKSNRGI